MLLELRIQDFAIIGRVAIRLERGLNVLTGETGAGKSIIVGALSLLLGERASSDGVRQGADRAVVEGVFDVAAVPEAVALLREHGIDTEDGLVIVRREVAAEGRNRAWVNGAASTAAMLGELGRHLVDLHGQHEHQALLRAEEQRAILDAFGGHGALVDGVANAHSRVRRAAARLEELDRQRRDVEQRADLLRHQAGEIERASIRADEEAELSAEANRLEHAEVLARLSGELHRALYDAEDALTAKLSGLRRTFEQLVRIDETLAEWSEPLENAFYTLEEMGRRMGQYRAGLEQDPERLDAIRRRQDLLFRLKAKYGPELADVIASGRRARAELDTLDRAGLDRVTLAREHESACEEHVRLCAALTDARRAAGERLDEEITGVLPNLGMRAGRFSTELTPVEAGSAGAERVEFKVALNAGLEARALARTASGGELSRIMLALKATVARADRVPTLVFDEVDSGIGGRVAHHVGEELKRVAAHHQVFVVTHLAQIASRADHHLLVEKRDADDVSVSVLGGDDRVTELARLLGGDPENAVSQEHAREMLAAR